MAFGKLIDLFVEQAPITVMQRVLLENLCSPEKLNAIFVENANVQYERELLFSSIIELTSQVVCRSSSSILAAYNSIGKEGIGVSITSVYNKLKGVELGTSEAIVRSIANDVKELIAKCKGGREPLLAGYRVRILDGNHLGKTNHRLKVLRGTAAGALPGQALVLLDPEKKVVDEVIFCEDGHAQERSFIARVAPLLSPKDLIIADRNFCTSTFLLSIVDRDASFIIRQHRSILPCIESLTEKEYVGETDTGKVYEEPVSVRCSKSGRIIKARRIEIHLKTATQSGDKVISVITNLPRRVKAIKIAELYRNRWQLENVFNELTTYLQCEIISLGYPAAALFGFAVAICSYNIFSALQGVLRGVHGEEKIEIEVSVFYLIEEVRRIYPGMMMATDTKPWQQFQSLSLPELCKVLVELAKSIDLKRYPKAKKRLNKPKKKLPKAAGQHVATERLLHPDKYPPKKKRKKPAKASK